MIVVLAIVLFVGLPASAEVYNHSDTGFSISVPEGWAVVDGHFNVSHYREVLVALNSIDDPTLRVKDWSEGSSSTYGPDAVARQLGPGAVYIDVAVWSGPPTSMPAYSWFPEYAVQFRVDDFAYLRRPQWETDDLVSFALTFPKLGRSWDVRIYCRMPFDKSDLDDAFEAVSSLRFSETPVTDAAQAVDAAIPHLPEEAKPKREWLKCCGEMYRRYAIQVTKKADAFLVHFTTLDGTNERKPTGTHSYVVGPNGDVEIMKSQ